MSQPSRWGRGCLGLRLGLRLGVRVKVKVRVKVRVSGATDTPFLVATFPVGNRVPRVRVRVRIRFRVIRVIRVSVTVRG